MSAGGYWRNWERSTAWLMREIVFQMISGNPNIKKENKPKRAMDIIKISDDKIAIGKLKKQQLTPEEIEEMKKFHMNAFNKK